MNYNIVLNKSTGEILAVTNTKYYRDLEINTLLGDYSKALSVLGWAPDTSFSNLVKKMVQSSIKSF